MLLAQEGTREAMLKTRFGGKLRIGSQTRKSASEYRDAGLEHAQSGTVLPFADDFGGVEGAESPYGQIVPGAVYRPVGAVGADGKVAMAPTDVVNIQPEVRIVDDKAPASDDAINPEAHRALMALASGQAPAVSALPAVAAIASPSAIVTSRKTTRVRLEGDSGSFSGQYLEIIHQGQNFILAYDVDGNIYTPPADQKPIRASWGEKTLTVFYTGISFESGSGIGYQIFLAGE